MVTQSEETNKQDLKDNGEPAVLYVECDPSLKRTFKEKLLQSGFSSVSDAIKTLVRDFVSGRINYSGGMLKSQVES